MKQKSDLETQFWELLIQLQLDEIFQREFEFHPSRKWRFDFADEANKVAVEMEGGTFGYWLRLKNGKRVWRRQGDHNTGTGYKEDTHKYNSAVCLGWRVLRYTNIKDAQDHFIQDYAAIVTGNWQNNYGKDNPLDGTDSGIGQDLPLFG